MLNSFIPHRMEDTERSNPATQCVKPASVLIYNKTMGAVDSMDQVIRPYQALRKTVKWYKKFAFHFFDISIFNSFAVYKYVKNNEKLSYKVYLEKLVEEILQENPMQRPVTGRPIISSTNRSMTKHFPQVIINDGRKRRSNCHLCNKSKTRKMTPFKCIDCGVWLCVGTNNCFAKFHNYV